MTDTTRITRRIPWEGLIESARQNARVAKTFARRGDEKRAATCREAADAYHEAAAQVRRRTGKTASSEIYSPAQMWNFAEAFADRGDLHAFTYWSCLSLGDTHDEAVAAAKAAIAS